MRAVFEGRAVCGSGGQLQGWDASQENRIPKQQAVCYFRRMILETLPVVQQLSADDKIRLWEELWDQIAADESRWPAREDHLALLNERLEHYRAHPETASTWEDVQRRFEESRRR
ncbi:MAG: addiction module protein [Verrucomicrobiaceae bacterium]|nr:addiction module protein [Verrucomicrobiaceae bacterium]